MSRTPSYYLSSIFFGVFTAPIFTILWFVVPLLRDFPVGDDSPHGVGLPIGFIFGVAIGIMMNSMFRWGPAGRIIGVLYLAMAVVGCGVTFYKAATVTGWDGIGWLLGFLACLHVLVSAVGLLLSGILANRAASRISGSDTAST